MRVNDVISYIMTAAKDGAAAAPHESSAKRAYASADVTPASSSLKPDVDWYLYKQIFPPIERLCAPMPQTDAMQLAECLGLDTRKYSIASAASREQTNEISPLESQIPDSIRFKDCVRLNLTCRYCKQRSLFEGLAPSISNVTPEGIVCGNTECRRRYSVLTLVAQLEHVIRLQTSRYYDGYLACDDSSCGNRTRQMSVYGHRCLGPSGRAEGCLGKMRYEMGEKELYNQLLYFQGLWDVEGKALKIDRNGEEKEKVKAMAEWNRERFGTLKGVVEGYLKRCGRVWVQMDALFEYALTK